MASMNITCSECKAKFWKQKTASKKKVLFAVCCKNGRITLPNLEDTPKYLKQLLDTDIDFKNNIRAYNSMLSFASFGASVDERLIGKKGNYCFRIHGSIYHFIGSVLPEDKIQPKFAQIYIYDTDFQTDVRLNRMSKLNKDTLVGLQDMMQKYNHYV